MRGPRGSHQNRALPNEGYVINDMIRATTMRVISHTGDNLGNITREEALTAAREAGCDLVQIVEGAGGVTAKIMDFGKFLYEKKKHTNEAKKKQKVIELKEVKMRPNIDGGDYKVKLDRMIEFLSRGMHVKVTLQFRGREIPMRETLGRRLFGRIVTDLEATESVGQLEVQKESGGGPMWSKVFVTKKK